VVGGNARRLAHSSVFYNISTASSYDSVHDSNGSHKLPKTQDFRKLEEVQILKKNQE
jgi:hypothetical protein